MSIIKKKKKADNSSKRPRKILLTNDHIGRIVPRKYIITRGDNIETPALVEIVPNYTKCNNCKLCLGKKEEDLADVLDYNCIECFEMQIEEEFSSNSMMITSLEVSKKRRKK